jgi:hypothetical protein
VSTHVAIAHQSVTAPITLRTRPAPSHTRYASAAGVGTHRTWTTVRLVGLVLATAMAVALATAIVAGTALFALLNFAG